jgi:hypothetical protein
MTDHNLEFWAFRDRPRCFYNQKIVFTFDRKPIAEATVLKIEEPGQSVCSETQEYLNYYKVLWRPDTFRKYTQAG